MAHPCIHCGSECHWSGDLSNSVDSHTPGNCQGFDDEATNLEDDQLDPWLCSCGNYITNGLHCPICKREPPWGCDCPSCHDARYDEQEDDDYDQYLGF